MSDHEQPSPSESHDATPDAAAVAPVAAPATGAASTSAPEAAKAAPDFGAANQSASGTPASASASAPSPAGNATPWERSVLEKLVFETLREQRSSRRWTIFFRCAFLFCFLLAIWVGAHWNDEKVDGYGAHTALINIEGTIDSGGQASAEAVLPALNKAFSDEQSVGVIIRINSPGGSPVQAGIINDEITRLRKQYPNKPVYVVVDEMCASGGYYIAVAADRIYVNKASIVGSIGVLMDGFGFTGLMEKLGVERRLMTAGENKAFLDPFSSPTNKQKAYVQAMLDEIHQQFIDAVRKGRGKRLKENSDTFSGLFWNGSKAVELGLADDFGTVESVARDEFKQEDIVDYTQREDLSDRVLKKFGAAVGSSVARSLVSGYKPAWR